MRKNTKKGLAVGATAAVLAGTGVAFAYWTSDGAGSGTGAIGTTTSNVVLHGTAPALLYPGGPAAPITLTADNPNSYSVKLDLTGLSITSVACGTTDVQPDPASTASPKPLVSVDRKSWFSLSPATNQTTVPATSATPSPAASSAGANGTIFTPTVLAPHSLGTTLAVTSGSPAVAIAMLDDANNNQNMCKNVPITFTFTTAQFPVASGSPNPYNSATY